MAGQRIWTLYRAACQLRELNTLVASTSKTTSLSGEENLMLVA